MCAIGLVEVAFGQTDRNATQVVGDVKLELAAYGFVKWRKDCAGDWRVEDLLRKAAIGVDLLNAVHMLVSKLIVLDERLTDATVLPSMATCMAMTTS